MPDTQSERAALVEEALAIGDRWHLSEGSYIHPENAKHLIDKCPGCAIERLVHALAETVGLTEGEKNEPGVYQPAATLDSPSVSPAAADAGGSGLTTRIRTWLDRPPATDEELEGFTVVGLADRCLREARDLLDEAATALAAYEAELQHQRAHFKGREVELGDRIDATLEKLEKAEAELALLRAAAEGEQ